MKCQRVLVCEKNKQYLFSKQCESVLMPKYFELYCIIMFMHYYQIVQSILCHIQVTNKNSIQAVIII